LVSSNYRNDRLTELYYRSQVFQPNSYTSNNRYPELFKIVQEYFRSAHQDLKICSFGCSTGSEVATLLGYFPRGKIIGIDINPYNLKICREKYLQKNTSFLHSLSKEWLEEDKFDAIFCLAVLQHTYNRNPNNKIAKKFTFRQFNEQIQQFDAKLKIGGLLILDHCDFLFTATDVFSRYRPLEAAGNYLIRQRPYYGSSNHREADCFASYRVFQKLA
jgi:chemotaxis methyl-accepting protein methylase